MPATITIKLSLVLIFIAYSPRKNESLYLHHDSSCKSFLQQLLPYFFQYVADQHPFAYSHLKYQMYLGLPILDFEHLFELTVVQVILLFHQCLLFQLQLFSIFLVYYVVPVWCHRANPNYDLPFPNTSLRLGLLCILSAFCRESFYQSSLLDCANYDNINLINNQSIQEISNQRGQNDY